MRARPSLVIATAGHVAAEFKRAHLSQSQPPTLFKEHSPATSSGPRPAPSYTGDRQRTPAPQRRGCCPHHAGPPPAQGSKMHWCKWTLADVEKMECWGSGVSAHIMTVPLMQRVSSESIHPFPRILCQKSYIDTTPSFLASGHSHHSPSSGTCPAPRAASPAAAALAPALCCPRCWQACHRQRTACRGCCWGTGSAASSGGPRSRPCSGLRGWLRSCGRTGGRTCAGKSAQGRTSIQCFPMSCSQQCTHSNGAASSAGLHSPIPSEDMATHVRTTG